jgi:hypothetical protein
MRQVDHAAERFRQAMLEDIERAWAASAGKTGPAGGVAWKNWGRPRKLRSIFGGAAPAVGDG